MRTPDDYARDWSIKDQSAGERKAASGAGTEGTDNESANPYRWDMPVSPEWGIGADDATSYGHSDDVKEVNLAKEAGKNMLRDGYERGEPDGDGPVLSTRQPGGSFPQSVPSTNAFTTHDRSREFSKLEEGEHSGADGARSSPGKQLIGSRQNLC